jgi:hypothetical protein
MIKAGNHDWIGARGYTWVIFLIALYNTECFRFLRNYWGVRVIRETGLPFFFAKKLNR